MTKGQKLMTVLAIAVLGAGALLAFNGFGMGHHMGNHDAMHAGMADGEHDEVNMPGLRGENATDQETVELATLFRNFETITRDVENLPNGIRTVTRSSDPEVMTQLVSHVSGMIGRVETGDDPKVFIQSPTLDIFFAQGEEIKTEIDLTDDGIVVVQTSNNSDLVTALHVHAAEVTAMADRGMTAVHEMMAKRR